MRNVSKVIVGGLVAVGCGVFAWAATPDAPSRPVSALATQPGNAQPETPKPARARVVDPSRAWRAAAEQRLSAIESTLNQPGVLGGAGSNNPEGEAEPLDTKPTRSSFAQAALGDWMADTLRSTEWDPQATHAVEQQVTASLAALPNTHANEVECGRRFCRATFFRDDGERPALGSLMGAPPFTSEGFMLNEPDGRIAMYFTRAGESIENLRAEASSNLAQD